ncbi:hypothetical protein GQ457_18G004400 [Hibiscus cannabinus]
MYLKCFNCLLWQDGKIQEAISQFDSMIRRGTKTDANVKKQQACLVRWLLKQGKLDKTHEAKGKRKEETLMLVEEMLQMGLTLDAETRNKLRGSKAMEVARSSW